MPLAGLTVFVSLILLPAAPVPAQGDPLAMARAGRPDEAWALWSELRPSAERSRLGVALAALVGDVARGLTIYDELVRQSVSDEPDALAQLAVASARGLATDGPPDLAYGACGIVLGADPTDPTCLARIDAIRMIDDPDAQSQALYRLANAGYRPWPDLLQTAAARLSTTTRLAIVRSNTRLPSSERLGLLRPVFEGGADLPTQRAAVALVGDLEGPDATALLRTLAARPLEFEMKIAVALALARRGDAESLSFIQQIRSTMMGASGLEAAAVLTVSGSPYGPAPEGLLGTAPEANQARLAVLLAAATPDAARATVHDLAGRPAPATRQAALRAAGDLAMGFDRAIYSHLVDADPAVRLAAIEAVLATIDRRSGLRDPSR